MSTATAAATGVWVVDKIHSSVGYEIEHNGSAVYRGGFKDIDGRLEYGADGAKLTGVVKLESNDLKDEQQRGHVLSPDFFDTERYPEAAYESTSVYIDGRKLTIEGELTLKGQSRPLTVVGTISEAGPNLGGGETVAVQLDATINRTDWGVSWNADLPSGVKVLGDEVKIAISLELVQV